MDILNALDILIAPIVFFLILTNANSIKNKNIDANPAYEYYTRGLMAKVFGGIAITFIYIFYYGGGDTIEYWKSSRTLSQMIYHYPTVYFDIMLGNLSYFNFWHFDKIGFPYYWKDPTSYAVVRYTSVFAMLTVNSIIGTVMLVAWLSYKGVWKLYLVFTEMYPRLTKELAIAILFIPSVVFWGSGVLKDTFTFGAACWFTYSFYNMAIKRRKVFQNILAIVAMTYIIISIKPYIFIALIPGCIIWLVFARLQGISNPIIRFLAAPMIFMLSVVLAAFVFSSTSGFLGAYSSVDSIVNKAVVTQQDLKREAYEGNSFDIGDFDPTLQGMLSKSPQAITAGLFRPFIWEANNPVMLISGLENLIIMLMFLYFFVRYNPIKFISSLFSEPMIIFSFSFAVFFSFAVGLTTSNFGSLVRYKIPAMPFFLACILIVRTKLMGVPTGIEATSGEEVEEEEQGLPLSPLPSNIKKIRR